MLIFYENQYSLVNKQMGDVFDKHTGGGGRGGRSTKNPPLLRLLH